MRIPFPGVCILLAACHATPIPNDAAPIEAVRNDDRLAPGMRAVPIGENGANFPACVTHGIVAGAEGGAPLLLRAAPFDEADTRESIGAGRHLFVCSRSIDQRWLGVVVPPLDSPDADCGVAAPVETMRPYAGPCRSGWVSSARVRLTAG